MVTLWFGTCLEYFNLVFIVKPGSHWVFWFVGVVRRDPRDKGLKLHLFVFRVSLRGPGGPRDLA